MLNRIKQRLRYWFNPIRCSACRLRCLSRPGLGRHLAKHRRERAKFIADMPIVAQFVCGVSDCKLPMPHNHFQEGAK